MIFLASIYIISKGFLKVITDKFCPVLKKGKGPWVTMDP
jgi:hypothetical protein